MYILDETTVHHKRFTLPESLIAIIIVYIATTIGLPGSAQTIRSSQLTTSINELAVSLSFSRSIAIKRNQPVSNRKSDAQYAFPLRGTGATSCTPPPSPSN